MTTRPNCSRRLKGGIVLLDPESSAVRIITLQHNTDTLTRSLQVQSLGGEKGDKFDVLRLKRPPVETIKFDAEIAVADQLEFCKLRQSQEAHEHLP